MVKISKAEKDAVVKIYPDVQFTRTMRQDSKRHHYYMVEQPGPMRLIRKLRGETEQVDKKNRRQPGRRSEGKHECR